MLNDPLAGPFRHLLRMLAVATALILPAAAADRPPPVPRFSIKYVDRTVDPSMDFYQFATGNWRRDNPVPADKAEWGAFDELVERNWWLVHSLLEELAGAPAATAADAPIRRLVGDFYASAMDTDRLEKLAFSPLAGDLARIRALRTVDDAMDLLANWHLRGIGAGFATFVQPDARNSATYALYLWQGGLGLPDRDYYLAEGFATQREEYRKHITTLFKLLGDAENDARSAAEVIISLETEMAKASRTRTELLDQDRIYNKLSLDQLNKLTPALNWPAYFRARGIRDLEYVIVGQPEFFQALNRLAAETDGIAWVAYLRWHLVNSAANQLHAAAYDESFKFHGTVLSGQPQPEPRWQRAAKAVDAGVGEALGQLYVEKHFPPAARARMVELIGNLGAVFRDRLTRLDWMSEATRREAIRKFDRMTQKIGHPEKFRDYSGLNIQRDDYLGNVQRANEFESRRQAARIGKPVDRGEWPWTPQTVNAFYHRLLNEIVFPAGILQPPFFDPELDDAVNYGAIGQVIGHEITHGYDSEGRKFDADGNLRDWWTAADGQEFDRRAEKLVKQYGAYEALPGSKVNGQLTLGENIADLGGTSIAFEALQRALAKDPSKRKNMDGFTPEQRFFLSLSQLLRVNWREADLRRRLVMDPHSPGQFRGIGPHVNLPEFYEAWPQSDKSPWFRKPEDRAKIW